MRVSSSAKALVLLPSLARPGPTAYCLPPRGACCGADTTNADFPSSGFVSGIAGDNSQLSADDQLLFAGVWQVTSAQSYAPPYLAPATNTIRVQLANVPRD